MPNERKLSRRKKEHPESKESILEKIWTQSDLDAQVREAAAGARLNEARLIEEGIKSRGLDFAEWLGKHIAQLEAND
jgi:hypothetical protein